MEGTRSLRDRLRELGALKPAEPPIETPLPEPEHLPYVPPESAPEPGVEEYLPGFWQDTPYGRIFVVEQRYELDHLHGAIPLGRTLDAPGHLVARLGHNELLREVVAERILYLDTETTGLSGGTGTYAFLVGIGHFVDGGFRLRQYFQTDFGQEPALLR